MKKSLIVFLVVFVFIFTLSAKMIQIPGTRISIDISTEYIIMPYSNMIITDNGYVINVLEINISYENAVREIEKPGVEISGFKIKDIYHDKSGKIVLQVSSDLAYKYEGYCIVMGSNESSTVVFGVEMKSSGANLDALLQMLLTSTYDPDAVKDFSEILYYEIESNNYKIDYFIGDRFIYKYTGELIDKSDEIEFEIGSILNKYKLTDSMHIDAAKSFSFRPPFYDNYKLFNNKINTIIINNIKGVSLDYNFSRLYDNKTGKAIEYILFFQNRIYFLRFKIYSDCYEKYEKEIIDILNTFKLI